MKFVNKSEITMEKYLYFCNNPVGKKAKKKLKNWKLLQIFAMAVMLVNAVVCYVSDALPIAVISLVLCFAFAYKLLVHRNMVQRKQYKAIMENQPDGKWYRTITFDKDIKVTDGNTVTTYKYSEYKRFDENDRYYLLYKNENAVLRVEKGAFIEGTDEDFAEYMLRRIKNK